MAHAIQAVRRCKRTVPQHFQLFRVREPGPVLVHLPSVTGLKNVCNETMSRAHEFTSPCNDLCIEQKRSSHLIPGFKVPALWLSCKLIYYTWFLLYRFYGELNLFSLVVVSAFAVLCVPAVCSPLHAPPPNLPVRMCREFHGPTLSPSCLRCALSVEAFALKCMCE